MGIPRDLDPDFIGPSWVVGSSVGFPAVYMGSYDLSVTPGVSGRLPALEFLGPGVWPFFVFSEIGPSLGISPLLS